MSGVDPVCLWCGKGFRPRTSGGSTQRFCSAKHRHEFGSAARRWAVKLVEAGLISPETLKTARTSAHAVRGRFQREIDVRGVIDPRRSISEFTEVKVTYNLNRGKPMLRSA